MMHAVAAGLDQILRQPSLRKQLLSAASTAVIPVSRKPAQYSLGLAWFLGAMSLVLIWQAATPFMPRTAGVDQTVTAALVPLWRTVSSITAKAAPAPLAVDPVEKQLVNQIRERDRQMGGLAAENHRLRGLLHMAGGLPQGPGHELASQVVARDSSAWLQTLMLDSGRVAGAANGMAVVAESGVIGRIADVSDNSARVQTITYRGATTSASIPTRHTAGVVYGVDGRTCEMRYLDPNAGVKAGDAVLTNGLDGYPEGLAVGRVQSLRWAPDGVSEIAVVKPAVALDTVRDVLILQGSKR
jgi:rod shape-determining protein MreC